MTLALILSKFAYIPPLKSLKSKCLLPSVTNRPMQVLKNQSARGCFSPQRELGNMKNNNVRRRLALSLSAVAVFAGMAPAVGATGPATAVTTKLDVNEFYLSDSDYDGVNYRTIAGTATGVTSNSVDLLCLNTVTGTVDKTFNTNITVKSGKWSTRIDLNRASGNTCRLAALPNGTTPTGETAAALISSVKSFTGPFVRFGEARWYYSSLGSPDQQLTTEVGLYTYNSKSYAEIWGVEDSGLYNWRTRTDGGVNGTRMANGFFSHGTSETGPTSNTEASMKVDGVQAFMPYNMDSYDTNATKANSPKISYSYDKSGVLTYTETFPLFRCATSEPSVVQSSMSNCPDDVTVKLGVTWTHEVKLSADGSVANAVDTFTSIDKKAHTVIYDGAFKMNSSAQGYRYAKTGAFGSIDTSAKTKLAGVGAKYDPSSATTIDNPIAQIVFTTVPVTTWTNSGWSSKDIYARWSVAVAAGKSGAIKTGAALITDDTKATAQIAAAAK